MFLFVWIMLQAVCVYSYIDVTWSIWKSLGIWYWPESGHDAVLIWVWACPYRQVVLTSLSCSFTARECGNRLKKLNEEFYEHVDPAEVADMFDVDLDTVDCLYNYWVLKRKVMTVSHTYTYCQNITVIALCLFGKYRSLLFLKHISEIVRSRLDNLDHFRSNHSEHCRAILYTFGFYDCGW